MTHIFPGVGSTTQCILKGTPDARDTTIMMEELENALAEPSPAEFPTAQEVHAAYKTDPTAPMKMLSKTYDKFSAKGKQDRRREAGANSNRTGVKSNGEKTKRMQIFDARLEILKAYKNFYSTVKVPKAFVIKGGFATYLKHNSIAVAESDQAFGVVVKRWGAQGFLDGRTTNGGGPSESNKKQIEALKAVGFEWATLRTGTVRTGTHCFRKLPSKAAGDARVAMERARLAAYRISEPGLIVERASGKKATKANMLTDIRSGAWTDLSAEEKAAAAGGLDSDRK